MGLTCSHGAFDASYRAFDAFRAAVCTAMRGIWPAQHGGPWYWGPGYSTASHPGLFALLSHADHAGQIAPGDCAALADELEALLPRIAEQGLGAGHILRDGGYRRVALRFIEGCRLAAASNEPLTFT